MSAAKDEVDADPTTAGNAQPSLAAGAPGGDSLDKNIQGDPKLSGDLIFYMSDVKAMDTDPTTAGNASASPTAGSQAGESFGANLHGKQEVPGDLEISAKVEKMETEPTTAGNAQPSPAAGSQGGESLGTNIHGNQESSGAPKTIYDVKINDADPAKAGNAQASPAAGSKGGDPLVKNIHGLHIGDDPNKYNMDHGKRGPFIIINNKTFSSKTGMSERSGTDKDAMNLYLTFQKLGFSVELYDNLTVMQMLKLLTDAARKDNSNMDCFACAILSHGDEGVIYGTDGIIELQRLTTLFRGDKCLSLAGKPKLFFIQACRGNKLDDGALLESDAVSDGTDQKTYRIPAEADFLYAYSTTPGYYSWRNTSQGSWFVQGLCDVMKEHGKELEILHILTRTNRAVAYKFESNASRETMNKKKQIPSIVSQLTKEVYFGK